MSKSTKIIDLAIRAVAKEQREAARLQALQAVESLRISGDGPKRPKQG